MGIALKWMAGTAALMLCLAADGTAKADEHAAGGLVSEDVIACTSAAAARDFLDASQRRDTERIERLISTQDCSPIGLIEYVPIGYVDAGPAARKQAILRVKAHHLIDLYLLVPASQIR